MVQLACVDSGKKLCIIWDGAKLACVDSGKKLCIIRDGAEAILVGMALHSNH
eukprot:CAMPEP_0178570118 /NCGR_PEP_ID=MMETSP0697-20121206/16886_1 /TAXON_ID=265572 /ORGANISM="Extubocellulus spinifer, Strain CCMP396" /LENGTH=51 /DNA_ID=CAMNT_0020204493 /DNA_START=410 /DNA_END=565 /DNA_ORIENTATION=-